MYIKDTHKCDEHNENIDIATTQNLATIPILYMDQVVLGAYQVSGNFKVRNGEVDKKLNDSFIYFSEILGYCMSFRLLNGT